jgi:hypothetical protein
MLFVQSSTADSSNEQHRVRTKLKAFFHVGHEPRTVRSVENTSNSLKKLRKTLKEL